MNKHKLEYKTASLFFLPFLLLETYFSSNIQYNQIVF